MFKIIKLNGHLLHLITKLNDKKYKKLQ